MNELEIIIPAYNAHKTILKTLDSISIQTNLPKYHVTIVNDCGKDYKEIIKKYKSKINIDEIKTPNNIGPGGARQYGIDNTKSKYITFIDSDDIFYNKDSVNNLYKRINQKNIDMVVSSFIFNREGVTEVKTRDSIWLHGKIYRREFLEKNNIEFNNSRANEDNGFNSLVILLRPTIVITNDITYIYYDNPNSITRRNNHEYKFSGLEGYAYNINWAIEEASKRNAIPEDLALKTMEGLVTMYRYYNELYNQYDIEKIIIWSKGFYLKYLEYKQYIDKIEKQLLIDNKPIKEYISFDDYKYKIKKIIK